MSDQSQGPGWWQASDGKWYPPQQHPTAAPPAPAPPAWAPSAPPTWTPTGAPAWGPPPAQQGMNGCLKAFLIVLALGVVLFAVGAVIAAFRLDDAAEDFQKRDATVEDDAEVTDCGTNEVGDPEASIRVTNDSADRSNYIIEVSFESPDGSTRYATGTAFANALRSGQTTTVKVSSFTEGSGEPIECVIADVTRFSDEP